MLFFSSCEWILGWSCLFFSTSNESGIEFNANVEHGWQKGKSWGSAACMVCFQFTGCHFSFFSLHQIFWWQTCLIFFYIFSVPAIPPQTVLFNFLPPLLFAASQTNRVTHVKVGSFKDYFCSWFQPGKPSASSTLPLFQFKGCYPDEFAFVRFLLWLRTPWGLKLKGKTGDLLF